MPEPSPFHRFVWIECAPFDKLAASRSELRVRVEAVAADQTRLPGAAQVFSAELAFLE